MFTSFFNRLLSHSITQQLFSRYIRSTNLLSAGMHSNPVTHTYSAMKVKVLPALSDNYMYMLVDLVSNEAAVIDPVDPETVIRTAYEENVFLTTVLTTHHHWDHAGGNTELLNKLKGRNITVVGGDNRIQSISKMVKDGDEFKLGSLTVKCLHTPCHTKGHICYHITSSHKDSSVVFTGDTLFIAGCGRFFEGTGKMMNEALNEKLANLPDETKVYCGHEYTVMNLKFAETVEPNNYDVKKKLEEAIVLRSTNEPTVPSTIGEEKRINPFMRVNFEAVKKYAREDEPVKTMVYVRKRKDSFKI